MNLKGKWRLILAIGRDRSMQAIDQRVAVELAQCMNPNNGAYPSQSTLAKRTGVSVRTVSDSLKRLEAAGYFEAVAYARGGRGHSTVYRFGPAARTAGKDDPADPADDTAKPEADCRVSPPETRQPTAGNEAVKPATHLPCSEPESRQLATVKPATCDPKAGSRLPTNPLIRTRLEEPLGETVAPTATRAREIEASPPRVISTSAAIDQSDPLAPVILAASPPFRQSRRVQAQRDWIRRELGRRQ